MRIYQIFFPELATYVKFKVLDPEEIQTFLSTIPKVESEYDFKKFKKNVIEHFIFNLKNEISDCLRSMSRKSAEKCLDAMYCGCIMLNPGLDIDRMDKCSL